jgi:pteridine reductase
VKNTALITGAAVRIGAAIAKHLAKKGYDIALHYNNSKEKALELKDEIKKIGVECEIFQADFSKEDEVSELIKRVKKEFPNLNLLINNASVFTRKNISETENDFLNSVFSINFKAPFILSRDFYKLCGKGNIINILDTKIKKNDYNYAAYLLTKKSLADLTILSAKEFGPDIKVNAIAPGIILPPENTTDKELDKMTERIPLKKRGTLEDIKHAVNFILENNYLTGEIIYIDGGQRL